MKKKLYIALSLLMLTLFGGLSFTACANGVNNPQSGEYALQMDKKYIYRNAEYGEQRHVLFRSNGTGEYKRFMSNVDFKKDYTISFKYTYVDDDKSAVVCFFDSVEYGDENRYQDVSTDWSMLLSVSKNVVMYAGSSYLFYVNEDYWKQLPNFAK